MAVRVTFRDRELHRGLRAMRRAGANLRPVLRRLKKPLRADLAEHAQRESGPDGTWPARASRRGGSPLLGKLPGLTLFRQRGDRLRAQNVVAWSDVQNEGGVVGRGSVVPARPFVFLSEQFLDEADEAIVAWVMGGWRRGR